MDQGPMPGAVCSVDHPSAAVTRALAGSDIVPGSVERPSPPNTPPPRRAFWRGLAWGALLVSVAGFAGYFAGQVLHPAAQAPSRIVEGDGVHGPKSMVWIPGGEFLMGSDHELAKPNERPTHRVRLAGFWMDRTHVT